VEKTRLVMVFITKVTCRVKDTVIGVFAIVLYLILSFMNAQDSFPCNCQSIVLEVTSMNALLNIPCFMQSCTKFIVHNTG
jgi:hypothetical protein